MIFLACWLEPGNYGLIAFATMLVATMGLFTDLGLFPSIARFVSDYTKEPTDLRAILSQGLTLKAAVLAVAMDVPVVSINYTPKVKHFMHLIGMEDYANEIKNLNEMELECCLLSAWRHRDTLKREIEKKLPDLKKKAIYPAVILKKLLQGESIYSEGWSN